MDEQSWRALALEALDNVRGNHRSEPFSTSEELSALETMSEDELLDAQRRLPDSLLTTPIRLLNIDAVLRWRALPVYEEIPASACVEVPYMDINGETWDAVCMVSWRWPEPKPSRYNGRFSPMPEEQLERFQKTLSEVFNTRKNFLWIDWCCVPQYSSDPRAEVARSRHFYARAATLLIIPDFKPLTASGMFREVVGSLNKSIQKANGGRTAMELSDAAAGFRPSRPGNIQERPSSADLARVRGMPSFARQRSLSETALSKSQQGLGAQCVLKDKAGSLHSAGFPVGDWPALPCIPPRRFHDSKRARESAQISAASCSGFATETDCMNEVQRSPAKPPSLRPDGQPHHAESLLPGMHSLPAISPKDSGSKAPDDAILQRPPASSNGPCLPRPPAPDGLRALEENGDPPAPSLSELQHVPSIALDKNRHAGKDEDFRDAGIDNQPQVLALQNDDAGPVPQETESEISSAGALLQYLPSVIMDDDSQTGNPSMPYSPQPPMRPRGLASSNEFSPTQNRPRTSRPLSGMSTARSPGGPGMSANIVVKSAERPFGMGGLQPTVVQRKPDSISAPRTSAPSWVKKVTAAETVSPVA